VTTGEKRRKEEGIGPAENHDGTDRQGEGDAIEIRGKQEKQSQGRKHLRDGFQEKSTAILQATIIEDGK
jgi:hypothetical protein